MVSDDPNPIVTVYPECSECGTAYVFRRCYSLTGPHFWAWQRDCKHKTAEPRIAGTEDA